MKMRILVILFAVLFVFPTFANAIEKYDEELHYKVLYKWGLIHKQAGRATLTLKTDGTVTRAMVCARTEPWADHIYKVRDTLKTSFEPGMLAPYEYHRIAHEGKNYAYDFIRFSINGNTVNGECTRYRKGKKDKAVNQSSLSLSAEGLTVDLLSSFYMVRSFDFANMKANESKTINIFSGKRKELLKVDYLGVVSLNAGKKKVNAYKVEFTFTSENKKKTSDPITAWISTDKDQVPLKVVGKLPIGQIQCVLIDK